MKLKHIINKHRIEIFVVFFLIAVFIVYISKSTLAQPFYQGETLDPPCVAGDPGCTVDILSGAFSTTSNVTSNLPGDLVSDDFVFGSDRLDRDPSDSTKDIRFFFDKSKGAFRAGSVSGGEWDDTSRGTASTAFGENTTASGDYSTAMGIGTQALSYVETVIGAFNDIVSYSPSPTSWEPLDRLFVIGSGTLDLGSSNAMVVLKNGNVGIGEDSPIQKLDVDGAIEIGTTSTDTEGTIRWTGTSFEGHDGTSWIPLDVQTTSGGGWTVAGSVVRLTTSGDVVGIGTSTLATGNKLEVAGGHIGTSSASPPVIISCSSSTSSVVANSTDTAGQIVITTGGSPMNCVMEFALAYPNPPVCTVSGNSADSGGVVPFAVSTIAGPPSTMNIFTAGDVATDDIVNYICFAI